MPEEKPQVAVDDRRWDELKFIQETLSKAWAAYLLYFVWFHTAVYGAAAYSMGAGPKEPSRGLVWLAATVCVLSEGLTIAVTFALGKYSRNAVRRVKAIVDEGNFHSGLDPRILLPGQLLNVTAITCVVSLVMGACAFLFVALLYLRS
jgi:hypothetical protein